ncbi:catabolite repression protein creC [Pseudohyphozyma bogoriensis]|nr:catabolite repression protein creC [Pseudohyphozyma bogoriensis]
MGEPNSHLPPMSWFTPPEGTYTLVKTLEPPVNGPPPTPQIGAPPPSAEAPPAPPPPHPARLAVASIQFPIRTEASTGLGLSMGLGGRQAKASKDPAETVAPLASPGMGAGGPLSPTAGVVELGGAGAGDATASPSLGASTSTNGNAPRPGLKRKAFGSSFSIPTLNVLARPGGNSTETSRPTRQFRGTTSSFVRSWEGLPIPQGVWKGICEANEGKRALFGGYTCGKGVVVAELTPGRPKEQICKVTFSVPPTCIDVNAFTASSTQLDLLVGFANGDIVWLDPFIAKYTRLNKSGVIAASAVTSIKWLPPTLSPLSTPGANMTTLNTDTNLFITSHADGTMLIWDKDREDQTGFVPNQVIASTPSPTVTRLGGWGTGSETMEGGETVPPAKEGGDEKHAPTAAEQPGREAMVVTRPMVTDKKGASTTKFNPVAHWRVAKKGINGFSFSPDLQYVACVGEDGCLRIIDFAAEEIIDTYAAYFGALTCVSWSPDGRFVVTGGQDDLVTVFAPQEQRLVARCQGHSSFITGLAWDPWRSDEWTSRFLSVGQDCKLILWDLGSAALAGSKAEDAPVPVPRRRNSTSSKGSFDRQFAVQPRPRAPEYHPAPRLPEVPMLLPVLVKALSTDLFVGVQVVEHNIVTVSRSAQIKVWERPSGVESGGEGTDGGSVEVLAGEGKRTT